MPAVVSAPAIPIPRPAARTPALRRRRTIALPVRTAATVPIVAPVPTVAFVGISAPAVAIAMTAMPRAIVTMTVSLFVGLPFKAAFFAGIGMNRLFE